VLPNWGGGGVEGDQKAVLLAKNDC
jgi:hypothetical protein